MLSLLSYAALFACVQAQGDSFNQAEWTPASALEANPQDTESSMLADIEKALGRAQRQAMESRIARNEDSMSVIFRSLPKNEYGKLDHSSVRYMLHRYLVEQHGWFIEGLFTEGGALNTSSPTNTLKNRVPLRVQGMFEKRLSGRGFGLHEIALLASVIENSIHQEAQSELNHTYRVLGITIDSMLSEVDAYRFIELYMTGFILKLNMSEVKMGHLEDKWRQMIDYYPTWARAKAFFNGIREEHSKGKSELGYVDIAMIIQEIVNTFGNFHGKQCQRLKSQLIAFEKNASNGCIPLRDFYSAGMHVQSDWLFVESPEYLRHIGALDDTDANNPFVLTANYINGPNSCLQPSGYYMVCCHNECDDILSHLEKKLQSPTATPNEILKSLPSSSTSPHLRASSASELSQAMSRRLQEIGDVHDGNVPIHGRLFAQWLHHVFPHECPYPHLSGARNPEWIEEYESETGKVPTLTDEQMEKFIENSKGRNELRKTKSLDLGLGSCAPWHKEEELFAPIPKKVLSLAELEHDPQIWRLSGICASVTVLAAMLINILRMWRSFSGIKPQTKTLTILV